MVRVMVFIDDDWLRQSISIIASLEDGQEIDYRRLGKVLGEEASFFLSSDRSDVVRTFVFGTRADDTSEEQRESGNGTTVVRRDWGENNRGNTRAETCTAFAAALCGYAAIPYAYDVAVVVTGSADLAPALRQIRRLGKRVVLASIAEQCDRVYTSRLPEPLCDTDIIWLTDIVPQMTARAERYLAECHSLLHQGDRRVWIDYLPRRGRPFYCDECRRRFVGQQRANSAENGGYQQRDWAASEALIDSLSPLPVSGEVCKVVREKGYGFIKSEDGREFFFHVSDLNDLSWEEISTGLRVSFLIKRDPGTGRAGAAGLISRLVNSFEEEESDEKSDDISRSIS